MKVTRDLWQRALAIVCLMVCLIGGGFAAWLAVDGLRTGVVLGRHSARHVRAEGDPIYYFSVGSYVIGSVIWLALAAFAVLVMIRWKDWT